MAASTKSQFRRIGERIQSSPFVVVIFGIFALMAGFSLVFMAYDYFTSFQGAKQLPVRIGWTIMLYLYAGLPQLLQIAAGYVLLGTDTNEPGDRLIKVGAVTIWVVAFLTDNATDITYSLIAPIDVLTSPEFWTPTSTVAVIWALILALCVHTFGSEFMFVWGFGMVMVLYPHARKQWLFLKGEGPAPKREPEREAPAPPRREPYKQPERGS